jgi:hypothetical protein
MYFPCLAFALFFWVAIICISRAVDNAQNGDVRQEKNATWMIHNTVRTLQNGGDDTKRIALEILQNTTEWWKHRQSEPERLRQGEAKVAQKTQEEQKKLEKLRRSETIKQKKYAELTKRKERD